MTTSMVEVHHRGPVRWLTLARPQLHNAFNERLISELDAAIEDIAQADTVRVVVLAGQGPSFCAGADLEWMRATGEMTRDDNQRDAARLGRLFRSLDSLSKPVVARVHGPALGGGVGLLACADVVLAADSAVFGLTEVRLGLAPAVISPFVVAKIGASAARRYFLTGERFSAAEALRMGLVHEVVPAERLDPTVDKVVDALLSGGPRAQHACKALVARLLDEDEARHAYAASVIAGLRVGDEGQEGMRAFLEKRTPSYRAVSIPPPSGDQEKKA